jgi:hypothetical protein
MKHCGKVQSRAYISFILASTKSGITALHLCGDRSPGVMDAVRHKLPRDKFSKSILGAVLVPTLDMATAKLVLPASLRHRVVPLGRCVRASSKCQCKAEPVSARHRHQVDMYCNERVANQQRLAYIQPNLDPIIAHLTVKCLSQEHRSRDGPKNFAFRSHCDICNPTDMEDCIRILSTSKLMNKH